MRSKQGLPKLSEKNLKPTELQKESGPLGLGLREWGYWKANSSSSVLLWTSLSWKRTKRKNSNSYIFKIDVEKTIYEMLLFLCCENLRNQLALLVLTILPLCSTDLKQTVAIKSFHLAYVYCLSKFIFDIVVTVNYILVKENRVQVPESSGVWGLGRDFWTPWAPAATVVFPILQELPSTVRTSTLKIFTAWTQLSVSSCPAFTPP